MKEIKDVTNILHLILIDSQPLKNININIYYGGPLVNSEQIEEFPFTGPGIECYYMMIRRKLKTLNDLKRKIMEELNLNTACYDIKIIYRYPQEVLHEQINYGSEPLAEVDTEEIQQTTTSLQFTILDDGCTTMGGYTMESYMLPSQDHIANTGETLQPQEIHLGEEDEDEDEDEDHAANNGENLDDMDEYEERIERGDFHRDVDDHELVPNFEEENMEYHDEGTQYNYYTIPRGIDGTALLHYVFWAFAPCIAAFKYCRPVINIDGTHLYGKYRGVLMIAMATDANQKVLPLAFAVVDKESGASWGWFLECLRVSIEHVIPKEGICIISDRHKENFRTYSEEFNHEIGVYQVVTLYNDHRGGGNHSHEVHVFDRTCGCEKCQNIKIPCSHAIKVLQGLHLDATSYIDPCYSLGNAIQTYAHQFAVPKSESLWRDVRGPRWVPDAQLLRAKGRPVKSRIRNEMDGVRRERESQREDSDLREIQPRQRYGVCHEEGHNRRRCPNSSGASTSGERRLDFGMALYVGVVVSFAFDYNANNHSTLVLVASTFVLVAGTLASSFLTERDRYFGKFNDSLKQTQMNIKKQKLTWDFGGFYGKELGMEVVRAEKSCLHEEQNARRFRLTRQISFGRRHLKFWRNQPLLLWLACFARQFSGSVSKTDYLTLRNGFIMANVTAGSNFNFHKLLTRTFDDDFEQVVGIRGVVVFCKNMSHSFNTVLPAIFAEFRNYYWLPFIPLVVRSINNIM
ncbi:hypothetical protein SO802_006365 [Lithocarpus litseifolius]|uniref:SWIM-type domain-containing protein n=1 Tax=Lithocarpus litseifolius TaxID=425828 RepID=A0AAW2DKN8_9ROSI